VIHERRAKQLSRIEAGGEFLKRVQPAMSFLYRIVNDVRLRFRNPRLVLSVSI
jgi:hypothetical protein